MVDDRPKVRHTMSSCSGITYSQRRPEADELDVVGGAARCSLRMACIGIMFNIDGMVVLLISTGEVDKLDMAGGSACWSVWIAGICIRFNVGNTAVKGIPAEDGAACWPPAGDGTAIWMFPIWDDQMRLAISCLGMCCMVRTKWCMSKHVADVREASPAGGSGNSNGGDRMGSG
ncbi:hypothetical protein E2562_034154 [Oryza meyeriana var. granulata]|uniref:Uncharacterized protein n=1 Tax=Oryza meyeriana var. granulata TaxID=110450 RepID=A0A6G1DRS8_9ORYZ|nr:hypothetical protein E2562_034154 [Oryza meyeriana var. granulata]